MDEIAEIWAPDVGVTEMTDTDLVASRSENTNVSDPEYELHQLCATAMEHFDLPNTSFTLDYALRVELARLIDGDELSFGRDDFDVKYTIPQVGWFDQQEYETVELIPMDDVDTSERAINFSMPPVVFNMALRAVDEGVTDTLSGLCIMGLEILLGQE